MTNIQKVCDHLDLRTLHDLSNEGTEENPKSVLVHSLGQPQELAAGLHGFIVTPWFKSLKELDAFCARHLDKFLAVGPDEPAPDATNWK